MCQHNNCFEALTEMSRREFLVASAGSAMAGGWLLRAARGDDVQPADKPQAWPELRVAYMRPKEKYWLGWPGTAWETAEYESFLKKSRALLECFGQELQVRVSFEPEPLYDAAAVDGFVARMQAEKPAGVVVFPLHLKQWPQVKKIAESGVPTIIFAGLGTCFTQHIQAISRLPGVHLVSSPDFELKPVRFGFKMIRTAYDVRRMRIAVLAGNETKDEVLDPFGLQLRRLPRQRFADALSATGETAEVVALAEAYQQAAQRTVEPSLTDLINAARNYFAAQRILKDENCDGITMDCLGAVFDGQIPCPPCLAWSHFLDAGVPAICEADINAVMSHSL